MNTQETALLYEWLSASYPRNYKSLTEAEQKVRLDNLMYTFRKCSYADVINTYRRLYTEQKTEPHASEVLTAIRSKAGPVARSLEGPDPEEIYAKLQKHPEYDQLVRIYGKLEVRRMALISTQFGTMAELKWRLMNEA